MDITIAQLEAWNRKLEETVVELADERDQLKAHVNTLREAIVAARSQPASWEGREIADLMLMSAVLKTPDQSLAQQQVKLLESVADEWHAEAESVGARSVYADNLLDIAQEIRQKAMKAAGGNENG